MDPAIIGGIVSAVGSIASAGVSGGMTTKLNKKNRKWQDQIRNQQREWALSDYERNLEDAKSLWHMENEYNSPDAQRRRLEEAGYNPALALDGIANSSAAGDITTPDQPRGDTQGAYEDVMPDLSMLSTMPYDAANVAMKIQEIRGKATENRVNEESADSDIRVRQNGAKESDNRLTLQENQIQLNGLEMELKRAKIETERELAELTKAQTKVAGADYFLKGAQTTNLYSQVALNRAQTEKTAAETKEAHARIAYLRAEAAMINKNLEYIDREKMNNIGLQLTQITLNREKIFGTRADTERTKKETEWVGWEDQPYWMRNKKPHDSKPGMKSGWQSTWGWMQDVGTFGK